MLRFAWALAGRPPRPADLVVVAALVALAFSPVLAGSRSFFHIDLFFTLVPYWTFAADSVAAGYSPAWTPLTRGGYPLLANGEASLLYPLMLPFALAFPAHRALDLFGVLHVFVCGVGMWAYLREIGLGRTAAWWGGAGFALSGRILASTIWPPLVGMGRQGSGGWKTARRLISFMTRGKWLHLSPFTLPAAAWRRPVPAGSFAYGT